MNELLGKAFSCNSEENDTDSGVEENRYNPPLELVGTTLDDRIQWYTSRIKEFGNALALMENSRLLLNDWDLATLPKQALQGILTRITWLELQNNAFENIPKIIFSAKNLKLLDLSENKIKTIPYEISLLPYLELLNITENPLEKITEAIINMQKLKELYVSLDKLDLLAPSIIKRAQGTPNYLRDENRESVPSEKLKDTLIAVLESQMKKASMTDNQRKKRKKLNSTKN